MEQIVVRVSEVVLVGMCAGFCEPVDKLLLKSFVDSKF